MSSLFAHLDHVQRSRDPAVDQRRARRDLVDLVSHVTVDIRAHSVRIINLSPLGLMCRSDERVSVGERVTVWLPLVQDMPADIRWVEDGRIGMEFIEPIKPRIYDALMALIPPRRTAW
ncbi:PilZ domain-containing protein [Sphingobium sp. SA2]|uniref:PilZ domain-containing protein n=1 Tax=Sphingobium sp. SA2 TaxID=1524832 RepID=UPI0028C060C3|nr:PilZ domain-containing protein [Sphingobium sp. SA2]MDT7536028.1 PilZ domain-containing protein [Sphingobium sp. SA2]